MARRGGVVRALRAAVAAAIGCSVISGLVLTSCTQVVDVESARGVAATQLALTLSDARALCAPYPGKRLIVGSDHDDVIDGTSRADCIVAGGGDDLILAGGGDDVVFAGAGDDRVFGGDGQDTIFGGAGNDNLFGGSGVDELHGEDGADWLDGQGGPDRLFGDACHDRIVSGIFDSVSGGSGNDVCQGASCELPWYTPVCIFPWDCGHGMRCVTASGVCVPSTAERCEASAPPGCGSCVPTATTDVTCNGVDDDCNGAIDEDYVRVSVSCGVGACQRSQLTSCVAGVVQRQCTPGTPAASDTSCDGVDDNCNGVADEGYVSTSTGCGVGACAAHGSTSCVHGSVTNSCVPGAPAASDTTCDGIDDDCDGSRDEDFAVQTIACGAGACAATGTRSCVAGAIVNSCTPGSGASRDNICNAIDDDCDGAVDEEYAAQSTTCGVGACASHGSTSCVHGAEQNSCVPGNAGANDVSCDGQDDDCDGRVDEDYASVVVQCGVGECARSGSTRCEHGVVQTECTPAPQAPTDASCDGRDDDCDGRFDEDYAPRAIACGAGACAATGTTSCTAGVEVASCTPGTPAATDSVCNGVDDNCNGVVDEDYAPEATSCGVGACRATGHTACVSGGVVDSCRAGAPTANDATCNGSDDDCDGAIDEDYHAEATACGVGACARGGSTSCVQGTVVDSCAPGIPAANDASCNGVDDDCDQRSDEDFVIETIACGVGACTASGTTSCQNGQVVGSCTPGAATADDSVCNGLDDDCNGQVDEDFAPAASSCGIGACTASGTTSCVAGSVHDSCVPAAAATNDATCDGVDDDCSGASDEDYVSIPTQCGVGVCAATGATACVAGAVVDSCVAHQPTTQEDALCDGNDDDCDGHTDEDYAPQPSTCGIGACLASGQTRCDQGVVSDGCTPGTPAPDDATCDGIDDDCGGADDEDYQTITTHCGVGACATTGETSCNGGQVSDSCTPLPAQGDDRNCNGVDDNCNGQTDEGFVPQCNAGGVSTCRDGTLTQLGCDDHDACTADGCSSGACTHAAVSCDDGNPCTIDSCDVALGCSHSIVVGASCSDGSACTFNDQCTAAASCEGTPVDSDDHNPCTVDICDVFTGVHHTPTPGASCDDGDACSTGDSCDATGACRASATRNCSDGLFCNGEESCDSVSGCVAGTAPVVDDHVACTQDSCDEVNDRVVHTPQNQLCSDNDVCTGVESCDSVQGCVAGSAPTIDDGNPCTADSCDPLAGVSHTALAEGTACGSGRVCSAAAQCETGVAFSNFANLSGVQLNGNAAAINATPVVFGGSTVLRLTNNVNQSSSAMLRASVPLASSGVAQSFSAHFVFQMSSASGFPDADGPGGDGMAFLIAPSATSGGVSGNRLGYDGVSPSVAIEFDTFENGSQDLDNGNHIGLNLNGNLSSTLLVPVATRFNNAQLWNAWIDYDANTHVIEVRVALSNTRPVAPNLTRTLDVRAQLARDNAFIGFTAGTGTAWEISDVRSLVWTTR